MTFSSITSWQINREKVEAETNFIFLVSKITAEGNFSCEIQRHAPWKESYNNSRKHIEKQIRVCFPPAPAPLLGQDPRQPCVPALTGWFTAPCALCFLKLFGIVLPRALQTKGRAALFLNRQRSLSVMHWNEPLKNLTVCTCILYF